MLQLIIIKAYHHGQHLDQSVSCANPPDSLYSKR